jgi:hypothetical protein
MKRKIIDKLSQTRLQPIRREIKEEIDQLKESTAQKEKLIRQMIQGTSA